MGLRDHMQERSYLTRSLCCPQGERKTLRVWVRLLSMGPRVCIPKRTISCQLRMGGSPDRSMWQDGRFVIKFPYVDFMALEIILLVLTDFNIQFHGIILRNFVFHHLIILVTLLQKNDLAIFSQQFPKLKHVLQTIYNHEICISPTPINYATYWALAHPPFSQFFR